MTTDGTAAKAKGSVKEANGKVTGDARLQAEGQADKVAGHAKAATGSVRDAARETLGLKANP